MLDDFFTRAMLAGIGVAVIAGPLGCFIVWRRLAYFGDTLAHAALLGVAMGWLLELDLTLSVFMASAILSMLLLYLQRRAGLSSDALLGLLSHSALALGLVAIALMSGLRLDLTSLLFGDILAVTVTDLITIYSGGLVVLITLSLIWRSLFAATISLELAEAENMTPQRANIIFTLLLAGTIAIAMKIAGVLLITAMLIIPAATARRFATGPEQMALIAIVVGILAVVGGMYGSLLWDIPTGPAIVVASLIGFIASLAGLSKLWHAVRERTA